MEGNKQEVMRGNQEGTSFKPSWLSLIFIFIFAKPNLLENEQPHIYISLILPTIRGRPQHCTLVCVLSPITSCLILFWKVRNISSVFISRVKMHSTRYDLSPRRCPLPWCPRRSGPCWSSIAPRGQQDNRTAWSCLIFDSTVSSGPAGGDICEQTGQFSFIHDFFFCG